VRLLYLPHTRTAEVVADAMIAAIKELPPTLRRTVTWDQGHEMAQHARISIDADIDVYFCDPHSRGNGAATRTPTDFYASTSRRAPTSHCTPPNTSPTSPTNSTDDPANASTGTTPPTASTNY
jgi:hypothetical protein